EIVREPQWASASAGETKDALSARAGLLVHEPAVGQQLQVVIEPVRGAAELLGQRRDRGLIAQRRKGVDELLPYRRGQQSDMGGITDRSRIELQRWLLRHILKIRGIFSNRAIAHWKVTQMRPTFKIIALVALSAFAYAPD